VRAVFRRYPLSPDEPPDWDSRVALVFDQLGRRAQDSIWFVLPIAVLMTLLVVLAVIVLLLAGEVAMVVLAIRLVEAAFHEPLPGLLTILAGLPGLVISISAVAARHRVAAGTRRLRDMLTHVIAFITRPPSGRMSSTSQDDPPDIDDSSSHDQPSYKST
jgi:hypothetical protein